MYLVTAKYFRVNFDGGIRQKMTQQSHNTERKDYLENDVHIRLEICITDSMTITKKGNLCIHTFIIRTVTSSHFHMREMEKITRLAAIYIYIYIYINRVTSF